MLVTKKITSDLKRKLTIEKKKGGETPILEEFDEPLHIPLNECEEKDSAGDNASLSNF